MPVAENTVQQVILLLHRQGCLIPASQFEARDRAVPTQIHNRLRYTLLDPPSSGREVSLDHGYSLEIRPGSLHLLSGPPVEARTPLVGACVDEWCRESLRPYLPLPEDVDAPMGPPQRLVAKAKPKASISRLDVALYARMVGPKKVLQAPQGTSAWERLFEEPPPPATSPPTIDLESVYHRWDRFYDQAHKDLYGIDTSLADFNTVLDSIMDARLGRIRLASASVRVGMLIGSISKKGQTKSPLAESACKRLTGLVVSLEYLWTDDAEAANEILEKVEVGHASIVIQ